MGKKEKVDKKEDVVEDKKEETPIVLVSTPNPDDPAIAPKFTEKQSKELAKMVDKFNEDSAPCSDEMFKTGSISMDYLFGGGYPVGRSVLLSAPPGLGKTLIALCLAKQRLSTIEKGIVLYLDAEKALSLALAQKILGPLYSRFIVHTPRSYEVALKMVNEYAGLEPIRMVIVDSITQLQPESVFKDKDEEKVSGRLGGKAAADVFFCYSLRMSSQAGKFGVLFLNQIRANISMGYGGGHGPATKAAGGYSLKHSVDFNVMMKSVEALKDNGKNIVGCSVKMMCEKNRVVGNRTAVMFLKYGIGFSNIATLIDMVKMKYGSKAGAYVHVKIPDLNVDGNFQNKELNDLVVNNFDAMNLLFNREDVLLSYFSEAAKGNYD